MAKIAIKERIHQFIAPHRYAFCCVLSATASLLGFVNPILSSFIAENILNNINLKGIIPTFVSMLAVKGTRMYLRSIVASQLKGGMRAPAVWLQRRISKRIWWLEPMVDNWGWIGLVITRVMRGGVPAQAAAFIASMITDTINALMSGVVYYFTQSYILSLLTALIIPSFAVVPWFTLKTLRYHRKAKIRLR